MSTEILGTVAWCVLGWASYAIMLALNTVFRLDKELSMFGDNLPIMASIVLWGLAGSIVLIALIFVALISPLAVPLAYLVCYRKKPETNTFGKYISRVWSEVVRL